jgi:hypothetical protein
MLGDWMGDWIVTEKNYSYKTRLWHMSWCGRGDSNPHECYFTATSTLRVYQFRHDRKSIGW